MKSIQISEKQIIITYHNSDKAKKIYDGLYKYEQEECTVNDNVLTYTFNWENNKVKQSYLYYIVKKLFRRSNYKSDISYEEYHGDISDLYANRLNAFIGYDKVFRITPINRDGTLGRLDFGVRQYTNFISFVVVNETDEFVFLSDRCHVGDFEHHELRFDDTYGGGLNILIEVATLQL